LGWIWREGKTPKTSMRFTVQLPSFKRLLTIVIVTVLLFYLIACTGLFFAQRSFLYHPITRPASNGSNISIQSDKETINVLTREVDAQEAVIYFGGNSEDVSFPLERLQEALSDKDLYFVDYRGFGGSTGSPSEKGFFGDAVAVYDHVRQKHSKISVIGRSLGSGVAVYLASARPVERLVLITPYDSITNVAYERFPIFPISLILTDKFDSVSRIKSVSAATLILLAESDEVIPRERSEALVDQFPPDQVEVRTLKGTNHGSIGSATEYSTAITNYLGVTPK